MRQLLDRRLEGALRRERADVGLVDERPRQRRRSPPEMVGPLRRRRGRRGGTGRARPRAGTPSGGRGSPARRRSRTGSRSPAPPLARRPPTSRPVAPGPHLDRAHLPGQHEIHPLRRLGRPHRRPSITASLRYPEPAFLRRSVRRISRTPLPLTTESVRSQGTLEQGDGERTQQLGQGDLAGRRSLVAVEDVLEAPVGQRRAWCRPSRRPGRGRGGGPRRRRRPRPRGERRRRRRGPPSARWRSAARSRCRRRRTRARRRAQVEGPVGQEQLGEPASARSGQTSAGAAVSASASSDSRTAKSTGRRLSGSTREWSHSSQPW